MTEQTREIRDIPTVEIIWSIVGHDNQTATVQQDGRDWKITVKPHTSEPISWRHYGTAEELLAVLLEARDNDGYVGPWTPDEVDEIRERI